MASRSPSSQTVLENTVFRKSSRFPSLHARRDVRAASMPLAAAPDNPDLFKTIPGGTTAPGPHAVQRHFLTHVFFRPGRYESFRGYAELRPLPAFLEYIISNNAAP